MRIFLIVLTMAAGLGGAARAQAPAPAPPPDCSAPEFRQFDFWIGDWTVTAGGRQAGVNRIERVLDGCALAEHWTSASGVAGTSLNFYDRASGAWHQAWTDARGGALRLTGGLVDGRMVMRSEPQSGPDGASLVQRITWSRESGGRVRQLWESSTDGGRTWSVAFDGLYAPAE
jgi:hypothetical protein